MSSSLPEYDRDLLSYYYSKTLPELEKSEQKYKKYAQSLAAQCETVRQKIVVLYDDLKEANILFQNSKKVCMALERDKRRFARGEVHFPWCPCPNDDDDEDEAELQKACAKNWVSERSLTDLRKRLVTYKKIEEVLSNALTFAKQDTANSESYQKVIETYLTHEQKLREDYEKFLAS